MHATSVPCWSTPGSKQSIVYSHSLLEKCGTWVGVVLWCSTEYKINVMKKSSVIFDELEKLMRQAPPLPQ